MEQLPIMEAACSLAPMNLAQTLSSGWTNRKISLASQALYCTKTTELASQIFSWAGRLIRATQLLRLQQNHGRLQSCDSKRTARLPLPKIQCSTSLRIICSRSMTAHSMRQSSTTCTWMTHPRPERSGFSAHPLLGRRAEMTSLMMADASSFGKWNWTQIIILTQASSVASNMVTSRDKNFKWVFSP